MEMERNKPKMITCTTCNGKGKDPKKRKRPCPNYRCRSGLVVADESDLNCICDCHKEGISILCFAGCCDYSGRKFALNSVFIEID